MYAKENTKYKYIGRKEKCVYITLPMDIVCIEWVSICIKERGGAGRASMDEVLYFSFYWRTKLISANAMKIGYRRTIDIRPNRHDYNFVRDTPVCLTVTFTIVGICETMRVVEPKKMTRVKENIRHNVNALTL